MSIENALTKGFVIGNQVRSLSELYRSQLLIESIQQEFAYAMMVTVALLARFACCSYIDLSYIDYQLSTTATVMPSS